jgi:hypothetical protein
MLSGPRPTKPPGSQLTAAETTCSAKDYFLAPARDIESHRLQNESIYGSPEGME